MFLELLDKLSFLRHNAEVGVKIIVTRTRMIEIQDLNLLRFPHGTTASAPSCA